MYNPTNLQSTSTATPPISAWNPNKESMKLDADDLDCALGGEDDKGNVTIYPWMSRVHSNNSESINTLFNV
jgi:hypothetical protein